MKRNNYWRFIIVVIVVLWSLYETYPPTARPLVSFFQERAVRQDDAFKAIVARARRLEQEQPGRTYTNLVQAIGTNDIAKYFPFFEPQNEPNPTVYVLNRLQREAAGRIKLGIDLQGGTSFLVRMDTNRLVNVATVTNKTTGQIVTVTNPVAELEGVLSQAVEVLRRRVDRFGVAEPVIQPQGSDRILIQLPGLSENDRQSAMKQIQRAAFLEFRMVHKDSQSIIEQGDPVPPGYEILPLKQRGQTGREQIEHLIVKTKASLTGNAIKSAMVVRGNLGEPQIDFTLNDEGAKTFGDITRENLGQRLAIVLDGTLYSAPVIQGAIETGRGQISGGMMDVREAMELANVLENPLRAPLQVESSYDVDPTLGKDSIRSGIKASIIGVILVAGFMLVYYLLAGMVANVALITNIIILLGVMCSIGTTLTLPGIAGAVLTVGMAVDANVLIYERIREELGKGKSLRGAIAAGYARAFGTIFDSHVTTLISSVILIWMGTGTIKGFGTALTIGVAASLFTALVVTRLIFDWLLGRDLIKGLPMLHFIRATKLDFMKVAKVAFAVSWLLIAIGVGWGIHRGSSVFGVDFAGGDTSTFKFEQKVPEETLRPALVRAGVLDPVIQYQKDMDPFAKTKETLRIVSADGTAGLVKKTLAGFPSAQFNAVDEKHIGATVGREIQRSAIIASLLSLFGILVYVAFRYEFSFAVGAVLAVIHDVLMTIGWYCLSGREFDATTVAAILTIIGFSTNDTIVIFDRIREDLKLGVRGTFREVMNQALNQTLSRTIITSGTVFLATLSLYIFGGGAINAFAFTFLVGIITGTYSSIYIASALVLWWHKGQRPNIGSQVAVQDAAAAAKA